MSRLIESRENLLWSKGQPPGDAMIVVTAKFHHDYFDAIMLKKTDWEFFHSLLGESNDMMMVSLSGSNRASEMYMKEITFDITLNPSENQISACKRPYGGTMYDYPPFHARIFEEIARQLTHQENNFSLGDARSSPWIEKEYIGRGLRSEKDSRMSRNIYTVDLFIRNKRLYAEYKKELTSRRLYERTFERFSWSRLLPVLILIVKEYLYKF